MEEWHDFFVASAGSSAALTGLIFVGISINLSKVLSEASLPGRALVSLILLLTVMIISLLVLIPFKSLQPPGIIILSVGVLGWILLIATDIRVFKSRDKAYRNTYLFNFIINQVAVVPYIISGLLLINGQENGFNWAAVSLVFSFIKASADAWVLLIEINR